MKKYFWLILFGLFVFIPFDTFALEYKNPKIEMIGQQVGSDIESVIAGCEACSEIQNSSGIPHGIRIYFPDTLFADLDDVTISFNFRWVYNGQYDVWPRPPIMFHHNPSGTNTLADKFSVADWTYLDGYIQSGYWFRNHSVKVTFTHGLGNILNGYYYLDISFFENIYGSSVPYALNYKIELDTIYITNSRYDEIGVIIDNAADRIIESNEINKHANQENFDRLLSETAPELDWVDDAAGWLPPGPVDSVLNLPFTFLSNLFSNLNKSCQPVSVPLPFVSQSLQLPCIKTIYSQLGISDFLEWIGAIAGTFILYNYFVKLYDWVDKTLELEDQNLSDWGGV